MIELDSRCLEYVAMISQVRIFVIACGLVACGGGNKANNPGSDDDQVDAPSAIDAPAADTPADSPSSTSGVYAIPLGTPTGADQGSFYTATLAASGKMFMLDIDTGSTTTGLAGMSCTTCTGMSPLYAPGANATSTGKTDMAQYADGSGWSGSVYTDIVGLGHGSPDVTLGIVSITTQSMFFAGNEYQGILGLGPAALLDPNTDTTAYPDVLVAKGVTDAMAFELCPTDGTMWLGGYDATHTTGAMQYAPLLASGVNADFYSVNMTAMAIGGSDLGVTAATFDNPIVDTGTSLFYIPTRAETALLRKINADANYKALFPNQTLADTGTGCVTAKAGTTAAMVDAMLPKLSMTFDKVGGGTMTLAVAPLASYLIDSGGGQFCLGVMGGGDSGEATMGDTFMRAFVTVIDIANKQVGFAPTAHCAAPAVATSHHGPIRELGRGPHHHR
jgi:hypothetical protein